MKYLNIVLIVFLFPVAIFAAPGPITGTTVVCQSSTTSLSDATPGGTWSSSMTTIAVIDTTGIVTGVTAGTSTITYTAGGSYVTTTVTINPQPMLTSTFTPPSLCDSGIFNYAPAFSIPGTIFDWSRAFVPGIEDPADTGNSNPAEQLINTTYVPISVPYVYTLSGGGCVNTQTVTVIVNPTPSLSSPLTGHTCSGAAFAYVPSFHTAGTTYSWVRPSVTGIMPSTSSGTGAVSETLTNTTSLPITADYLFTLTANGCKTGGAQIVSIDVSPCTAGVPLVNAGESNIYPNPGNGTFTVYFSSTDNERVALAITNVVGEKVKELIMDTNTTSEIRLSVSPGVYFLSAVSDHSRYYGKVVVER